MKRIFSVLTLFFVLTTSAYAEREKFNYNSQKPVTCTTPERVKDVLGNVLGELPYFKVKEQHHHKMVKLLLRQMLSYQ